MWDNIAHLFRLAGKKVAHVLDDQRQNVILVFVE